MVHSFRRLLGALCAMAVAAPALADCLPDASPEELAAAAAELTDAMRFSEGIAFETLTLAEMAVPGSADGLAATPPGIAAEGVSDLGFLVPAARALAAGKADEAIRLVEAIDDPKHRKIAIDDVIPAIARLTGRYDLLSRHFPFGDGTYLQNLNARTPLLDLVDAGLPDEAITLFARHRFGYHTHDRLEELSRRLAEEGAQDQLLELLEQADAAAEHYRAFGAFTLCRERRSEDDCRAEFDERPRQRRLELYDPGAYQNCWLLLRDEGERQVCLAEIESRADAAAFAPAETDEDAVYVLSRLVILARRAELGDARPHEVPEAAFRDPGPEEARAHGSMIAALLSEDRQGAIGAYAERLDAAGGLPRSRGVLDGIGSRDSRDISLMVDLASVRIAETWRAKGYLEGLGGQPDVHDWVRDAIGRALIRLALKAGDMAAVERHAEAFGPSVRWLDSAVARAGHGGEPRMVALIDRLRRAAYCAPGAELSANTRLHAVRRLLTEAAVARGQVPESALRH